MTLLAISSPNEYGRSALLVAVGKLAVILSSQSADTNHATAMEVNQNVLAANIIPNRSKSALGAGVLVKLLAAVVFSLAFTPSVAVGMIPALTQKEITVRADSIVMADAVSVEYRLDSSANPVTKVNFEIVRVFAGDSPRRITVTLPGGRIGDRVLHVTGAPYFGEGDRVILFLDSSGSIIAGDQGRLGVSAGRVLETNESLEDFERRILEDRYGISSADTASAPKSSPSITALSSAPAITTLSPSSSPAGAGITIRIAGSGFGATAGAVEFSDGTATVRAERIVSWTNTLIEVEVPSSVSSGPVRVLTAGGTHSSAATLTVPYSLGRAAWTRSVVPFSVSATAPASWRSLVNQGALVWNGIADFAFLASSPSLAPQRRNGVNEVWWGTPGIPGALASAHMSFFLRDGNLDGFYDLVETDVIFSSAVSNWGDGRPGTFDIQSVAAHEFGHWLVLDDLYGELDRHKVMFGRIATGQLRRNPSAEDRAGIVAIYGPASASAPSVTRIWGPDRYRTAANISRDTFAAGSAPTAVLATGRTFPDALSASGLAGAVRGPLLLTAGTGTAVEPFVLEELRRVGASRVIIVGGSSAVSEEIERSLGAGGFAVKRIQGSDRYETSAEVAREIAASLGAGFGRQAIIARGDDFADALSAGPIAYSQRMPLLLTRPNELPTVTSQTLGDLRISSAIIVGGTSAVGHNVTQSLGAANVTWSRIAGACRFTTAEAIARESIRRGWSTGRIAGVATGQDFPDALAGGAATGAQGGVVLLTRSTLLSVNTASFLHESTGGLSEINVFGGTGAVCDTVRTSMHSLWGLP